MALSWTSKEYSIANFYNMLNPISDNRIDCDPVGQRPDVESMSKRQGIIDTVLRGYDFGELKLRTILFGEYHYRSIDGGHRKRSIRDYIDNKYKTNRKTICVVDGVEYRVGGMYYKDLPIEVKKQFNSYKIRFTVYGEEMNDEQAGEIFRRTNITTDVNHQEMLNSYEDNLVAKFVREISRPIRGLNNEYHDLFEYRDMTPESRKQYWFQSASTRLRDDEFVTRLLTMLTKSSKDMNWLTCSNRETEKVFVKFGDNTSGSWVNNPQESKRQQKLVVESLDFILNYAKAKKTNSRQLLSTQEFTIVSRLYVYLVRTFGRNGFRIDDWSNLYSSVRSAMDRFVGKDENNLRMDTHKDDKGVRLVCECFRQYLTVHDDQARSENSVKWLLEEMDIDNSGIVFLDSFRVFPSEMVEQVWRQQGMKCWVTGKTLDIKDAVGGHIIAHSIGGKSTIDNCMVCHRDENTRMGSMDAILYSQIRQEELGIKST
jgi:hypothetical protein